MGASPQPVEDMVWLAHMIEDAEARLAASDEDALADIARLEAEAG